MKKIQSKMEGLECSQLFSNYKSTAIFQTLKGSLLRSPGSDAAEFKIHPDVMVDFVTCKIADDPIKNEGARVVTTIYIYFSDGQGHITSESEAKI